MIFSEQEIEKKPEKQIPEILRCPYCYKVYKTNGILLNHLKRIHSPSQFYFQIDQDKIIEEEVSREGLPFTSLIIEGRTRHVQGVPLPPPRVNRFDWKKDKVEGEKGVGGNLMTNKIIPSPVPYKTYMCTLKSIKISSPPHYKGFPHGHKVKPKNRKQGKEKSLNEGGSGKVEEQPKQTKYQGKGKSRLREGGSVPGEMLNKGGRVPGEMKNKGGRVPGEMLNKGVPGESRVNKGGRVPGEGRLNKGGRVPGVGGEPGESRLNKGGRVPGEIRLKEEGKGEIEEISEVIPSTPSNLDSDTRPTEIPGFTQPGSIFSTNFYGF